LVLKKFEPNKGEVPPVFSIDVSELLAFVFPAIKLINRVLIKVNLKKERGNNYLLLSVLKAKVVHLVLYVTEREGFGQFFLLSKEVLGCILQI
jgi:hypothetical protein